MIKHEIAQLVLTQEELKHIDYALPNSFVEDYKNLLNIDPQPFFVWCYVNSIFGYPINLAEKFYMIYQNTQNLWDNTQTLIINAQDRGDCYDNNGNMHRDYLRVCHSLDQITLDKRKISNTNEQIS